MINTSIMDLMFINKPGEVCNLLKWIVGVYDIR